MLVQMKLEKRKDREAKYKMLFWLRIQQRCAFIATEVGSHSADCLGVSEKKMIECEVKTNMTDFKNDFKKHKHYTYASDTSSNWQQQWIPTHFYYAVPTDMVESVKEYLTTKVNEYDRTYGDYGVIDFEKLSVERRAKWLHKREPSSHAKFVVALRMGSELLRFHEAWV